jgi:hypothetical protein
VVGKNLVRDILEGSLFELGLMEMRMVLGMAYLFHELNGRLIVFPPVKHLFAAINVINTYLFRKYIGN